MENDILVKVKEFVASYWNESLENISDETRIEDDLGITGDDANEFMEDFQKKFDVDLTTFQIDRHFGPEVSFNPKAIIVIALIALIFGFLGWKNGLIPVIFLVGYLARTKKKNVSPNVLKVKHLIKAASERKWFYNYNTEL